VNANRIDACRVVTASRYFRCPDYRIDRSRLHLTFYAYACKIARARESRNTNRAGKKHSSCNHRSMIRCVPKFRGAAAPIRLNERATTRIASCFDQFPGSIRAKFERAKAERTLDRRGAFFSNPQTVSSEVSQKRLRHYKAVHLP